MQRYLKFPDVADALQSAITDKRPFSLIRLGDGEARIMGYPTHSSWLSVSEMMKVWFGHPFFSDTAIQQIQLDLKAACLTADILGLPDPAAVSEADRSDSFKAATLYAREFGYLPEAPVLTSPGVHVALEAHKAYERLFSGLDEVVLITSRDVAATVANRFSIHTVTPFLIPPEMQYSDLSAAAKLEQTLLTPHFPTRYLEVAAFIGDHVRRRPGVPVLVGAGILGKIYCCWAKSVGAIGIDIGSVFDLWAGLRTRANPIFSSARLVQDPSGRPPWLLGLGDDGEAPPVFPSETAVPLPTNVLPQEAPKVTENKQTILTFDGSVRSDGFAKPMQFRCHVDGVLIGGFPAGDLIGIAVVEQPDAGTALPPQVGFRVAFAMDKEFLPTGHSVTLEALDRRGDWVAVDASSSHSAFASVVCVRHRVVRFAVPPEVGAGQNRVHAILRLPDLIVAGYHEDDRLTPLPPVEPGWDDGSVLIRVVISLSTLCNDQAGFLLPASCADRARLEFFYPPQGQ
ncbi:GT-D fold domain-containing protein [Azospirillum largimobile]